MGELKTASKNLRTLVLLEFTKQLLFTQYYYGARIQEEALHEKIRAMVKSHEKKEEKIIETPEEQEEKRALEELKKIGEPPKIPSILQAQEIKEVKPSYKKLPALPYIPTKRSFLRRKFLGLPFFRQRRLQQQKEKPSARMHPKYPKSKASPFEGMTPSIMTTKELPPLPSTVAEIKPVPSLLAPSRVFDFGKFTLFIKDPTVTSIIWSTEDFTIHVKRVTEIKKTAVTLQQQEAERFMQRIAQEVKIPLTEGFFRAVIANLIISAIIHEGQVQKITLTKILRR
jgi:hypothetical protein